MPAPPKKKSTGSYADKFKVNIPIADAVGLKPNLRGYISNLVAEAAYK